MERIGLMLGYFDPIHLGHLAMVRDAQKVYRLDTVYLYPLPESSEYTPVLSLKKRRKLIGKCVSDSIKLLSSTIPLVTEDSLIEILSLVQERHGDAAVFPIMGMDRLSRITNFAGIYLLPAVKALIVYSRVGYSSEKVVQLAQGRGAHSIFLRKLSTIPSSEQVREQISLFNDVPEWVPSRVMHAIARKGYYLPNYKAMLKPVLSQSRLKHTISVRKTAVDLAYRHDAPMLKTSVAAMLHDCAKCMTHSAMQKIARDKFLTEDGEVLSSPALLHGVVGAYIAKSSYGIRDKDILNAITYHTVGRPNMTDVELCVLLADSIEPLRPKYPGLEEIRILAKCDLKSAALASLRTTKSYILSIGGKYSMKAQDAIDDLLKKLTRIHQEV
ncbi:MAG: HD domain-containing protein [Christensenellaceae bacterium]|nr:HD domain-containing protein [Christensenellaceae bacterium]